MGEKGMLGETGEKGEKGSEVSITYIPTAKVGTQNAHTVHSAEVCL